MMKLIKATVAIAAIAAIAACSEEMDSAGRYVAASEFTIDMRRDSTLQTQDVVSTNAGREYTELFNTLVHEWRSEKVVLLILQQYRASHPTSTVSDEELIETLAGSKIKLQSNSRIITISVRARQPVVAAALANAYTAAIEKYTEEQNRASCDRAVAGLHADVEKQRREVDRLSLQLLNFRTDNKLDTLRESRDIIRQGLEKTTADILALESQEVQLDTLAKQQGLSVEDGHKLESVGGQLKVLRKKQSDLRNEFASVEQRIVLAESGIAKLDAEFGVANCVLEGLLIDESKMRIQAELDGMVIRVGRPAVVPAERK